MNKSKKEKEQIQGKTMENNKLIKTDTIWYKIKKFLYNIFNKKENNNKKRRKKCSKTYRQ